MQLNGCMMSKPADDVMRDMDAVFRAVGDPARRRLLDRLNERNGLTLTELCADMGMTRQSVSKHLDVLEAADLIATMRQGAQPADLPDHRRPADRPGNPTRSLLLSRRFLSLTNRGQRNRGAEDQHRKQNE